MKKLICFAAIAGGLGFSTSAFAQLQDEKDVTITMDLQPILQLNMSTADHLDFVFDDIKDYYAGIAKYGATILKVSSSVDWDLFAQGMSNNATAPAVLTVAPTSLWDHPIVYGTPNATNQTFEIPLSCLELHQSVANPSAGALSYFTPFPVPNGAIAGNSNNQAVSGSGTNCIYTSEATPADAIVFPAVTNAFIAGNAGTAAGSQIPPGSYLLAAGTQFGANASSNPYYFVIDYRIVPGLPPVFPNAFDKTRATSLSITTNSGSATRYAAPGVYTMHVKYILAEDQ